MRCTFNVVYKLSNNIRKTSVWAYTSRPHYAGEIWKRRFHTENASNVFHPHHAGGIWKRRFHIENASKCFPFTLRRRNLKTQKSAAILDFCLRKTPSGKSHDYHDAIVFEKLRFQNVFRPLENKKPAFSNFSGLKSVFEKLGLAVEIKLRFQISPLLLCGRSVRPRV